MYDTLEHIGDGNLVAHTTQGTQEVGKNLNGMVRYTYFEDFTLPPIGWTCSHEDLLKDYHRKVSDQIIQDRLKMYSEDPGKSDWIEKI
jgi:hypothetical protein